MVGYLNNKDQILNTWYQLFKQKNNIDSDTAHKYWKRIQTLEFPNPVKENWKYTSLKEFLTHSFCFFKNNNLDIYKYKNLGFSIDAHRLTFINGQFYPELSDKNIKPWIIKIDKNPYRHEYINPIQPEIFLYLTEYLSEATIHINLPQKKITKKPLYLVYINEGSNTPNKLITSHYNNYIEIEDNSHACIIEHFISINKTGYFSGARTSIKIGNRVKLHHIKLIFENRISYHISHNDINVGQCSTVNSNIFIILGPKLTRHQTSAKLNHSDSSLSLNSLSFLSEKDVGDIRTYVEHDNKGHTLSRQLHKIIASGYSTGTFNGLIKVNPNSINTDGKMMNNNLLLHQNATINSIPKLEIYSEDVKCNHGATIGQINTEHLFYLSTRGIPKKDAINMLIHSFAIEITRLIEHTVLQEIISTRINQALTEIRI